MDIFARRLLSPKPIVKLSVVFQSSERRPVQKPYNSDSESSKLLTIVSEESGVRKIILNNPRKRNALSLTMLEELSKNMFTGINDGSLRCIVLSSSGSVFSSGHDLKELKAASVESRKHIFEKCTELMLGISFSPVPVIAQVKGLAAAAGCQLVASCDIVIAGKNASFSTPGASVGLFCSTPGVAVSRMIPRKLSAYMLLTGQPITAEEALHGGLVSKVTDEEELEQVTCETVDAILAKSRSVISVGKHFYYSQLEQDIETAYRDGVQAMVESLGKHEAQEGIQAFFEKRQPRWKH